MLTDKELLVYIKSAIGIGGNYQDNTIQFWIDEVKEYMRGAGLSEDIIQSTSSKGVICRGVSDLWNYGAGEGILSPYFKERVVQLSY